MQLLLENLIPQKHFVLLLQTETYLGEKFWKAIPLEKQRWVSDGKEKSPIQIQHLDHSAIEVTDVDLSIK